MTAGTTGEATSPVAGTTSQTGTIVAEAAMVGVTVMGDTVVEVMVEATAEAAPPTTTTGLQAEAAVAAAAA